MPSESYEIVPSLINGEWLSINKDKYTNVYNPAKGEIISKTPMCGNKELDKARAYLSAYDFSKLKDWLSKDNQSTLASD